MKISGVKVRRIGEGEDGAAWARTLADASWEMGSRVLKQEGRSWVRRVTIAGRGDVVIKCRPVSGVGEGLKRLFRSTRGDRHWRGAAWLMEHVFPTPRPLVLAGATVDGVRSEVLVTEFVDAKSVLEHLAARDLSVREEHEAARAIARLLVEMAAAGRYNRDGKPSNLLLEHRTNGGFRVVTIDTVAIRRGGGSKFLRAMANLLIEAIGTGNEPRLALKARVLHEANEVWLVRRPPAQGEDIRRRRWYAMRFGWYGTERLVQRHGDPTPRVNPLPS